LKSGTTGKSRLPGLEGRCPFPEEPTPHYETRFVE
jgi:hypothetical protein